MGRVATSSRVADHQRLSVQNEYGTNLYVTNMFATVVLTGRKGFR